jgi:hypothetical protein
MEGEVADFKRLAAKQSFCLENKWPEMMLVKTPGTELGNARLRCVVESRFRSYLYLLVCGRNRIGSFTEEENGVSERLTGG